MLREKRDAKRSYERSTKFSGFLLLVTVMVMVTVLVTLAGPWQYAWNWGATWHLERKTTLGHKSWVRRRRWQSPWAAVSFSFPPVRSV
jgi:hypothetical protein